MDNLKQYHRQNTLIACGPASAQTVLDYLFTSKQVTAPFDSDQSSIMTKINSLKNGALLPCWEKHYPGADGWVTRPDELAYALNTLSKDKLSGIVFSVNPTIEAEVDPNTATCLKCLNVTSDNFKETLVFHISREKLPIVPVHGKFFQSGIVNGIVDSKFKGGAQNTNDGPDAHWIVLFQYQKDKVGFIGGDPWMPKLMSTVPTSHSTNDLCQNVKVYIHISATGDAFGKINFPSRSRVAVIWKGPGEPTARVNEPIPVYEPEPELVRPRVCVNKPFDAAMKKSLFQQLTNFGLLAEPSINSYLRQTVIATPPSGPIEFRMGAPRLVQRLDAICRDYYLVPLLKTNGESTVMVRVDAPTGLYLDSLYYSENPLLVDENTPARQNLVQTVIPNLLTEIGPNTWKVAFAKQINAATTEMVWLPCQQSLSAFFPFYVIKTPTGRFLVRVDGSVFLQLTY